MTSDSRPDTTDLLRRAGTGDADATEQLLVRFRPRLKRMVAVRLDPRVLKRIDPSDVVQDVLIEASRRMPEFSQDLQVPFFVLLRRLAGDRLAKLHQQHIVSRKRAVDRERLPIPDQSADRLIDRLADSGAGPRQKLLRKEVHERVRRALKELRPQDREILVMRHLEQMTVGEIAAELQLSEGAVKMRRLRAVQNLLAALEADQPDSFWW